MFRQIRNGVIGALATMAVIYLMGLVGIGLQALRLESRIDMYIVAPVGFIIAIAVGIFVLVKLSRRQP